MDRHGSGPGSPSALRTLLAETRQRGYAVEEGEVTPGFASVASAVLDHNGHPVAGVAVTFPSDDPPADLAGSGRRDASYGGRGDVPTGRHATRRHAPARVTFSRPERYSSQDAVNISATAIA